MFIDMQKIRIFLIVALCLILFCLGTAGVSPAAKGNMDCIHREAWRIDLNAGTPTPGKEREFEKFRRSEYSSIDVFSVQGETVTIFMFDAEDEFLIINLTAKLEHGKDGWFVLALPKLTPDANDPPREYAVKDSDTLLLRREEGEFVYKRIPNFNPPDDPLLEISPLPWQ